MAKEGATAIAGATSASYNTPTTSAPDSGAVFNVADSQRKRSVTSATAERREQLFRLTANIRIHRQRI